MSNKYDENSIDSKITQLLITFQNSESDRINFRATILKDLEVIKNNTKDLDHRLLKLEDKVDDFIQKQEELNNEILPVLESYNNAKGGYFTIKNILVGVAFLLSLYTAIKSI